MRNSRLLAAIIALVLVFAASASFAYTGKLMTDDGGLIATSPWDSGSSIEWWVTSNGDGTWHYQYELIVPDKDVSHVILETSEIFGLDDLLNPNAESGGYGSIDLGWNEVGPGNPNLPGSIYGIKFDSTWGTTLGISFDSPRTPVWGDFYAKDGMYDGADVTLYNAGFLTDDPLDPAADGTISNHILRPDTVVPEPSSVLALVTGLGGLGGLIWRRRK